MPTVAEGLQQAAGSFDPLDDEEDDEAEELSETQAVDVEPDTSDTDQPQGISVDEALSLDRGEGQGVSPDEALEMDQQAGRDQGITEEIVSNVAEQETGGVPEEERDTVRGDLGEVGRFQAFPSTAAQPGFGVEPLAESEEEAESLLEDPEQSKAFTQRYLEGLQEEFGSTRDALIAYNWGPGNTREWIEGGRDPANLPESVQEYVDNTLPKAQKAADNLQAGGVDVDEDRLYTRLDEQQQPEDRLTQSEDSESISDQAGDFFEAGYNYITTFGASVLEGVEERGAASAVGAAGRGLEFVERSVDAIGQKVTDIAEVSFTPEGVSKEERMEFEGSFADEGLDFIFENAAEGVLNYANTFQRRPSQVNLSESKWDVLKAENLGRIIGEQGPLAVGMIAGVVASPVVGTAAIGAIEGGDYLKRLDEIEQRRPGVDISENEKLLGAAGVGAVNMVFERLGIDRILAGARVPGVKGKILNTILGGGAEGITETAQELSQITAEDFQAEGMRVEQARDLSRLTEQDWKQITHAAYGGSVLGLGFSATGASVRSMIEKRRPDADLVDVEYDEDGNAVPVFQPRQHTNLEGTVGLSELQQNNLKVPEYRQEMLRIDWTESLRESLDDARFEDESQKQEHIQRVVDAAMILEDQKAAAKGVSLEEYLEENKVTPYRGGVVSEDVLNQFAGKKADMLQTERLALERAKELERQGFDKEAIRETTGWFRNPQDEMWRMEVPSHTMDFNEARVQEVREGDEAVGIGDIVDTSHRIFELYPELRNIRVSVQDGRGGGFQESMDDSDTLGRLVVGTDGQWKKTIWHELQHGIQFIEGFARGGTATDMSLLKEYNSEARELVNEYESIKNRQMDIRGPEGDGSIQDFLRLERELKEVKSELDEMFQREGISDPRMEAYRNVAGEIEARAAAERNRARAMMEEEGELESPFETLEREEGEDFPIITQMYDNPVRQQIHREGQSRLLQDDNTRRAGAFQQTRDGRTLIQLFENANESTIPHEMMHLFRRTMSAEQDQRVREELGIESWTREAEEKFARSFERFLSEGSRGTQNEQLQEVFDQYEEWMGNVYGSISGSPIGIDISDGVRDFFDSIMERRVQTEEGRNWLQRKVGDFFGIETRFRRMGLNDTGTYIKGHQTFVDNEINKGAALVNEIARTLETDEGFITGATKHAWDVLRGQEETSTFRERTTDVVLAAESDQIYENSPEDVQEAADKLRSYFRQAKNRYNAYGRIPIGFHDRLVAKIENRLSKLKEEGSLTDEQAQELNALKEQLQKVEDLNFVHIPVDAWFDPLAENKPDKLRRLLGLMADRQRETVSIKEMLEDPEVPLDRQDIKLEDILLSYSSQLGNDLSLLRIRDAAIREGAAVRGQDERLINPPREATVFQDYSVNAPLNAWLKTMVNPRTRGRFKEMINLSKMFAFWNPFFLPMYDVMQGAALGVYSPTELAKTAAVAVGQSAGLTEKETAITAAVKDVVNQTEEFWRADRFGLSSKPFTAPQHQHQRAYFNEYLRGSRGVVMGKLLETSDYIARGVPEQRMARSQGEDINRSLMDKYAITRAGTLPYQLSWDSSWFMDRLVRQVTYRHLRDNKDLSPQEAAQQAAEAHGDYASVPQETRDTLNTIFFTPTFKIAMGKFFTNSLRGVGEVVTQQENATSRMRAGVVIKSVALMTGFDAFMHTIGFERDEFGRKYCRPTDATRTPKEVCISWSQPLNLFSKYMTRVYRSINEPTNYNSWSELLNSFRWELNPLWRTMMEAASNQDATGGTIYNELDSWEVKNLKRMKYIGSRIFSVLGQFSDNQLGQKGKEVVADELGTWTAEILNLFSFAHTRSPEALRRQRQIENLMQVMDREVGLSEVQIMLRRDASEEEIEEFIEGRVDRKDEFMRRLDQVIETMQEQNAKGAFDTSPEPPSEERSVDGEGVSVEEALELDGSR